MSDTDPQRSDLDELGKKIAKARGSDSAAEKSQAHGASAGDGLRIAIEFVVSVLVGSALGYGIGSLFDAEVVGLLIGLPFGFAAGLRTVYRGMMAADTSDPAVAEKERDVPDGND